MRRGAGVGSAGAVEFPALGGTGSAGAVGAGGAGTVGATDAAMLVGFYEDRLLCGKIGVYSAAWHVFSRKRKQTAADRHAGIIPQPTPLSTVKSP